MAYFTYKKSLKIPKWHSEVEEQAQTIQWSKEKGQTMIYKTLHRKQKTKNNKKSSNPGAQEW